tara:strand:- start:4089 stop:4934 length:846 start_codon:yes stop_codon:yes gene_type:complete
MNSKFMVVVSTLLIVLIIAGCMTNRSEKFVSQAELSPIPYTCHRVVGNISKTALKNIMSYPKRFPKTKQIIHRNRGEDYVKNNAPSSVYAVYNAIRPEYYAARADLARYIILYYEGGLYLDDKSDFSQDVGAFVRQFPGVYLHAWRWPLEFGSMWSDYLQNPKGEICNWGMISAPKNHILKEVIKRICTNAYVDPGEEGGKFAVLRTTGPLIWSEVVQKYEREPGVRISRENLTPAQYTVFKDTDDHQGKAGKYYGDLTTPVIRLNMLPDLQQLKQQLNEM